jgi:hypothetical protein
MTKADFLTAVVLSVFSIVIIIISIRMPRMEEVGANPYSAPGLVPGLLGGSLFCLSLILLVRSIRKNGYKLDLSGQKVTAFFQDAAIIRVLLTIIISIIYGAILLGRIPYMLATFLYVLVFVILFEYQLNRPWREQAKMLLLAFLLAILTAGSVAAVFRYLFLVKLP